MEKWSECFQNPEYLAKTRMASLRPEMAGLFAKWLGLKPGLRILDVGCGSGELTRYLKKASDGLLLTGLDSDESFIAYAKEADDGGITYICADALNMPFESGSFDLVVSHTFLTAVPEFDKAIKEMRRVCVPDGMIASFTPINIFQVTYDEGFYPESLTWKKEYDELNRKKQAMYDALTPIGDYAGGIAPMKIPRAFSLSGMEKVSVHPYGRFFSLSDASMSDEEKRRYIDLDFISEDKRLDAVYKLPEAWELMTEDEVKRLKSLMKVRREYLLDNLKENEIWELEANGNLLVTGKRGAYLDETIKEAAWWKAI